jgi:plasmid stabilization system protein ParE
MDPEVVFHRLVQRDMDDILDYYKQNAPSSVANRFFDQFISTVNQSARNPRHFTPFSGILRRAKVPGFPFHFLFRETTKGIRVLVLRHDRRHPSFGLGRR